MSKKLLGLFFAVLLVFGIAGQALAAFEEGHLIRVVYRTDANVEVATDLGLVSSLIGTTNNTISAGAFSLADFGSGATLANLRVAYYAKVFASSDVWLSGTAANVSNGRAFNGFSGLVNDMAAYYSPLAGSGVKAIGEKTNASSPVNSYYTRMDLGGQTTNFGGFLSGVNPPGTEVTPIGGAQQVLYFYDTPNSALAGVFALNLRTNEDGTTTINAGGGVVPIPPSVLLLASGLLGLIGIRRRAA